MAYIHHEILTLPTTQCLRLYSRLRCNILRLSSMCSMSTSQTTFILSLTVSALQQECVRSSAAQTGGSTDDLNFTCKSPAFLSSVHACEAETCSPSDISRMPRHFHACIGRRSGYILMPILQAFSRLQFSFASLLGEPLPSALQTFQVALWVS